MMELFFLLVIGAAFIVRESCQLRALQEIRDRLDYIEGVMRQLEEDGR